MTTATKSRKTVEQRKHDHFLKLAILLRQGRLHRMAIEGHAEHTFENGEHVDFYPSETYVGFAYMVVYGQAGYECGCKGFEHRHSCEHTRDANERAIARYELAEAARVAAEALPEMVASSDLTAHVEDSIESGELEIDPYADERAAWLVLTPAQRREVYCNTFAIYDDAA